MGICLGKRNAASTEEVGGTNTNNYPSTSNNVAKDKTGTPAKQGKGKKSGKALSALKTGPKERPTSLKVKMDLHEGTLGSARSEDNLEERYGIGVNLNEQLEREAGIDPRPDPVGPMKPLEAYA